MIPARWSVLTLADSRALANISTCGSLRLELVRLTVSMDSIENGFFFLRASSIASDESTYRKDGRR